MKSNLKVALVVGLLFVSAHNARAQYLMEKLGRGVVATVVDDPTAERWIDDQIGTLYGYQQPDGAVVLVGVPVVEQALDLGLVAVDPFGLRDRALVVVEPEPLETFNDRAG